MRVLTRAAAAALALYLTGPTSVGLMGLGVPAPLSLLLSVGLLGAGAVVLGRYHRPPAGTPVPSAVVTTALILLAVARLFQISRLSLFMHDVARSRYFVPGDAWRSARAASIRQLSMRCPARRTVLLLSVNLVVVARALSRALKTPRVHEPSAAAAF